MPKTVVPNRVEILLWQTVGWLIIAAYCSSLAARLATWEYERRYEIENKKKKKIKNHYICVKLIKRYMVSKTV